MMAVDQMGQDNVTVAVERDLIAAERPQVNVTGQCSEPINEQQASACCSTGKAFYIQIKVQAYTVGLRGRCWCCWQNTQTREAHGVVILR
jgi:hypothetical protein